MSGRGLGLGSPVKLAMPKNALFDSNRLHEHGPSSHSWGKRAISLRWLWGVIPIPPINEKANFKRLKKHGKTL